MVIWTSLIREHPHTNFDGFHHFRYAPSHDTIWARQARGDPRRALAPRLPSPTLHPRRGGTIHPLLAFGLGPEIDDTRLVGLGRLMPFVPQMKRLLHAIRNPFG